MRIKKIHEENVTEFMSHFRDWFSEDELESNLNLSFISVFSQWLTRDGYVENIQMASKKRIESYNIVRRNIITDLYTECSILDLDSMDYFCFLDRKDLKEYIEGCLNNTENFVMVSMVDNYAIQTSYDFTDKFYYLESEDKSKIKNKVENMNGFIID